MSEPLSVLARYTVSFPAPPCEAHQARLRVGEMRYINQEHKSYFYY